MMHLKFNMDLSKGILRTFTNSVDPDQMLQYQTRIFCKMYKKITQSVAKLSEPSKY